MAKISWSLAFLLLFLAGCADQSKPLDMGGEDGSKVAMVVEDLNEVKHNAKKVGEFFVNKQVTPDVKKLNQMNFYIVGKPAVTGTTATCKVQIEKNDSTPLGEQEWQFEKVADQWKIKAAPLP